MITGETVTLIQKRVVGTNDFDEPLTVCDVANVEDVLVGQPTSDQAIEELNLYGKRIAYVLGIPKGDTHNWKDCEVIIRGQRFKSYGFPLTQTEANVPGKWNTQVKVEAYE